MLRGVVVVAWHAASRRGGEDFERMTHGLIGLAAGSRRLSEVSYLLWARVESCRDCELLRTKSTGAQTRRNLPTTTHFSPFLAEDVFRTRATNLPDYCCSSLIRSRAHRCYGERLVPYLSRMPACGLTLVTGITRPFRFDVPCKVREASEVASLGEITIA